jgi:hypothetical protein
MSNELNDYIKDLIESAKHSRLSPLEEAILSQSYEVKQLQATSLLVDELVAKLEWIKTDMSYKAPEQLKGMIINRWFPMIMDKCEALAKAKEMKK